MSDIRDYQANHLLLLVGANPMPNAVAGKLLTVPGGTITLIHSRATDSLDLAQRLKLWLLKAGYSDIGFTQVEEANAASVYERVREMLGKYESDHGITNKAHMARVGLNYTGGTKVMSVHAYRALEDWAKSHDREAIFSYLDARTLQMRFDQVAGRDANSFYVGLEVEIGIRDLLELHNWKLDLPPTTEPVLPQSAAALLNVYSNLTTARIWTDWLHNELFPIARKPVAILPPFWVSQSKQALEGLYDVERPAPNDQWKSKTKLRNQAIAWPDLPDLRETMRIELGQDGAEKLNLTAATGTNRCKDEEDFCKWLSGIWLECAVLSALQNCSQKLHLKDCYMDLRPKVLSSQEKAELFQFDVVAMHGYQLFAFSCSTESASPGHDKGGRGIFDSKLEKGPGRGLLKQKLFEAYVRARQMGGDEACVALVCCMEQRKADELEDEMRRDISPEGRIRVFGRECLVNLTEHITDWVRQQSKES
jgi:hypothetical protein